MMRRILTYTLILLTLVATGCHSKLSKLETLVKNRLAFVQGTFALAFLDLSNGDQIMLNANESFHAASTMKVPVLIELYRQAAEGKFSMNDSIVVKNEFKSIVDGSPYELTADDDSETDLYAKAGTKATIHDLAYDMITVSSNLATNNLIELVEPKNIMATMKSMNANDIQVLRGVEDDKAFQQGLNNTTTAHDLMILFKAIATGTIVNPAACEEMTNILRDQKFNEMIPAYLPPDAKVAHKTGSITGVNHDAGFVTLSDGHQYVLVILSKEVLDKPAAIEAMAETSKIIYDYVMANS